LAARTRHAFLLLVRSGAAFFSVALAMTSDVAAAEVTRAPDVEAALKVLKGEGDRAAKLAAIGRLGLLPMPSAKAIKGLVEGCKESSEPSVRLASVTALGALGPRAKAAVPVLLDLLDSEQLKIRRRAVWALVAVGPVCAKDIVRMAPFGDELADDGALEVLAKFPGEEGRSIAVMRVALKGSRSVSRGQAAKGLGLWGPTAAVALADLRGALGDNEEAVRWRVCEALGRIGLRAKSALPDLARTLKDSSARVRVAAALAIYRLTKKTDQALPVISGELQSKNAGVVGYAVECLAAIGGDARNALASVRKLQQNSRDSVAVAAALAEWRLSGESKGCVGVLRIKMLSTSASARLAAVEAISEMGRDGSETEAVILKLTEDEDAAIRRSSVRAFWLVTGKHKKAIALMAKELDKGSVVMQLEAKREYGKLKLDVYRGQLVKGSRAERMAAARGLAASGYLSLADIKCLETALRAASDTKSRMAVVSSLGSAGSRGWRSVPLLITSMQRDSQLRPLGRKAVRSIVGQGSILKVFIDKNAKFRTADEVIDDTDLSKLIAARAKRLKKGKMSDLVVFIDAHPGCQFKYVQRVLKMCLQNKVWAVSLDICSGSPHSNSDSGEQ
jgi:HEAT repeat protein